MVMLRCLGLDGWTVMYVSQTDIHLLHLFWWNLTRRVHYVVCNQRRCCKLRRRHCWCWTHWHGHRTGAYYAAPVSYLLCCRQRKQSWSVLCLAALLIRSKVSWFKSCKSHILNQLNKSYGQMGVQGWVATERMHQLQVWASDTRWLSPLGTVPCILYMWIKFLLWLVVKSWTTCYSRVHIFHAHFYGTYIITELSHCCSVEIPFAELW